MINKLFLTFDDKDLSESRNRVNYFSKLAGLTIFKRLLLNFQMQEGETVILVLKRELFPIVEKEIEDSRITMDIKLFDPKEKSAIQKALNTDCLFVEEESVFESSFLKELLNNSARKVISKVVIQNKLPKLQGDENTIHSGYYLIPSKKIETFNPSDFTKTAMLSWIHEQSPKELDLGQKFYLKIDSKKKIRLGEKGLLKFLRKPTDPLISRNLNRPVSLFLTRFLMHTPVIPNVMTLVTFGISLLSVFFMVWVNKGIESYIYVAIGGLLFHMASVVDGCDGELARLKFQFSPTGELLDGLIDDIKNALFTIAMGIHSYWTFLHTNPELANYYYYGIWLVGLAFAGSKILQYRQLFVKQTSKDILDYTYYFEESTDEKQLSFFSRFIAFFRDFARSDFMAFFAMLIGLVSLIGYLAFKAPSLYHIVFWIYGAFAIAMLFLVLSQTIINSKKASA